MAENSHRVVDIAPVLLVTDLSASLAWYHLIGFDATDGVHGEPPVFAMVDHKGSTIMLRQSENGPQRNHKSVEGMWDVYVWIKSAEATLAHLQSNGVAIIRGPTETPYGCTEIEVHDPDGHIICFGACP